MKKLLLILFAFSGMTALIYEVLWSRYLQLIFGSTVYAVSTILTTFFIGFTLGSYLFRNLADKTKNSLFLFSKIQLIIGLYGLIVLFLFDIFTPLYLSLVNITEIPFVSFFLIFLLLIIPTTLFGATWPIMNKEYVSFEKLGKNTGQLYSFNSFGAFVGSIGVGFILLPLLGMKTTAIFVASINILISFIIFIFKRRLKNEI